MNTEMIAVLGRVKKGRDGNGFMTGFMVTPLFFPIIIEGEAANV